MYSVCFLVDQLSRDANEICRVIPRRALQRQLLLALLHFVPLTLSPSQQSIMNSLRVARVALRARPAALKTLQKRGYADAVPDKIKLSLALPHQVCNQICRKEHR